jgi:hypothetical protein
VADTPPTLLRIVVDGERKTLASALVNVPPPG